MFDHPVFTAALSDVGSLGIRVLATSAPGARVYGVVGGRSNARWWLIPLESGRVAESGLALFQPLLPSARKMKAAATLLSRLGLQGLWARKRVYVQDFPDFSRFFGATSLSFAFFTGTDSPHRKVAIQVMDRSGRVLGFAKVTRDPKVAALLRYEAQMLREVAGLDLREGFVPHVLFSGEMGGSEVLLTDTLKTRATRTTIDLGPQHRAFLQEIASRTRAAPVSSWELADVLEARVGTLLNRVPTDWQTRFSKAIETLRSEECPPLSRCFAQGDFTPWNTFLAGGRLYVFDWEYADRVQLAGSDVVHFVMNQPRVKALPPAAKLAAAEQVLAEEWTGIVRSCHRSVLISYVLGQVLLQVERAVGTLTGWDGEHEQARMLSHLVGPLH
ncbi:hypothetical protein JJB11_11245 [Ramlibacter ginsenosidimutans]|uniref:Aminoglycoside phosphotransferase domain-containing protein n=1 Tax=Ramlibacter ginsenosidimutans TaxID=502333 RepID=A0A934TTU5_9BURK|nr:hypothetical protein [Ramlibacter ginsenosidimutans]MBK6006667.1 hypothetical protein [Ramlibacter ginsenosidimutans]